MKPGARVVLYLWLCTAQYTGAIHRHHMFPYGTEFGDATLQEGDDEISKKLELQKPLSFYETKFTELFVATNGIISTQDLPMEKQYVDDGFPTDFPVIAPFLADIDTSRGRGAIYYRLEESPGVLNRFAEEVQKGFPGTRFTPMYAVIATWEKVGAYEEVTRNSPPSNRVNTFQVVLGYDEVDSYALFLYPEDGLQFFGTRPKESYNVQLELPARVGFSRGEVSYFIFSRTEGPHYSLTGNEQTVKNLYQVGNTGTPGVWLFHIGSAHLFDNVVPATVVSVAPTAAPVIKDGEEEPTSDYPEAEYPDENMYETGDYYTAPPESQAPSHAQPAFPVPDHAPVGNQQPAGLPGHSNVEADVPQTSESQSQEPLSPSPPSTNAGEDPTQDPRQRPPGQQKVFRQDPYSSHHVLAVEDVPLQGSIPSHSFDREVVSVDEDVEFDSEVIQYSTEVRETCARLQQLCSPNAYCTDHPSGYCCHCNTGYYGNGQHCLPEGAPQRVNGKVSGLVSVGATPVELNSVDLHAYIVLGDGRAYTAISQVPEPVGWALMPVAPIGGLFGWLFALELPDHHNGFSITGAEFTHHAEVTFNLGNQHLSIMQRGQGLNSENYLTVDTHIRGSVPFIAPGATVQMEPYKETYQYYRSVVTSSSARRYTVASADGSQESFSYQLRQNITYGDCSHAPWSLPESQRLNMERMFVTYVKEESVLRYAITNTIGPVGDPSEDALGNPCYAGTHDCDTTALCLPGDGQHFQCRCATGYRGDGRDCDDVDECAEGLHACAAHANCVNLPGSHSCQCHTGFEFGLDGRSCVDVDECKAHPCHAHASCSNSLGSFECRCHVGFAGDGFDCNSDRVQPSRPKTQCEEHRDSLQGGAGLHGPRPGLFVPQCDEEGQYRALQCHGSTGHCWCVDSRGQERAGTRTPPGTPHTNCDQPVQPSRPKTQCEEHRDSLQGGAGLHGPRPGLFVPQCDEEGQYRALQCHGSTGHCWCVDSRGQERAGTRTPPGTPHTNCDQPVQPSRPKTQCEEHRDSLQGGAGLHGPRPGLFVPQCDEEGQYRALQCHGSTGHCWCVDSRGQERAGTRTPPGTPHTNCDQPVPILPTQRAETVCERWRASLTEHYRGQSTTHHYLPQCDADGQFNPVQCYGESSYCWCVDRDGREVPGTRSHDAVKPACIPTVAPPTMRPLPRPDVTPPPTGVSLLYAQGQQIGVLPLNGTRLNKDKASVLLALHGSIVVGIDYDCRDRKVYWTDLAGRTINRAGLEAGAEPEVIISTGLTSPEGLAVDGSRGRMFWVDSGPDKIETSALDGSDRRVLFDTDLVNPRAIIVEPASGTLYWTDWNREAPKIESATVDGHGRRVLVRDGIGLPNGLTFDPSTRQLCWADAGTKKLECMAADGTGRRVISSNLNYPFSLTFYASHFYYTDWRRDGVIGLSRDSSQFTDEYLPEQRSHLYGVTVAATRCLPGTQ